VDVRRGGRAVGASGSVKATVKPSFSRWTRVISIGTRPVHFTRAMPSAGGAPPQPRFGEPDDQRPVGREGDAVRRAGPAPELQHAPLPLALDLLEVRAQDAAVGQLRR